MFNEICIYEAKIEKQDEIETLIKEVAEVYLAQPGVVAVKYIKRTHRQKDFNAVKEGGQPIGLGATAALSGDGGFVITRCHTTY